MATATEPTPPANGNQIAKPAPKEIRVVQDNGPVAHLMDTARFEHTYRIATAMAAAALIPDHLVKSKDGFFSEKQVVGNCFLVVNQSLRWGIDPFAAMSETYAVGGKLGFQGKLIAAVVNARAGLKRRLNYTFSGTGSDLTVTVSGTFEGEDEARTITLSVAQAKTDNKMWTKDPEQKLIYSGATKWARRHCPEIMLGVLTDDDLEHMTINAQSAPVTRQATTLEDLTERYVPRATDAVNATPGASEEVPSQQPEATPGASTAQGATDADDVHQGEHIEDADQSEVPDPFVEYASENHPLRGLPTMLRTASTLGEITKAKAMFVSPDTEAEIATAAEKLCETAREIVRNNRGGRSSK